MERTKNDVWVGLFVLIGAAALVFLALQAANLLTLSFQPTYRLDARFDNIGGLKPRAAVKSSGVVVGRVESITFDDQSFRAHVMLEMENRYQFPTGYSEQRSLVLLQFHGLWCPPYPILHFSAVLRGLCPKHLFPCVSRHLVRVVQ